MIAHVWETSGRLLRLLGLLQRQTGWSAENLALECEVTTRTVRRDVARLRDLGYCDRVRGRGWLPP